MAGESSARYELGPSFRTQIRSYTNDGYRQEVFPSGDSVRVSVQIQAAPWPIREPFHFVSLPDWIEPNLREAMAARLARCQRQGEALEALLLELRSRLVYTEKPDFEETPEAVLKEGRASCVGLTLAALGILKHLGIEAREVLGLRLDPALGTRRTEGGILHAWLEVRLGGERWAFCDPWMSIGWVPENYLVLRIGNGLDVGPLKSTLGEAADTVSRQDRIFFEPAPGVSCVLWKRPPRKGFTGTLVTGKVLNEGDSPSSGRVTMISGEHSTTMDLWRGNFFFRDLEPGGYRLRIEVEGVKPQVKELEVRPMDKKHIVLCSQQFEAGDFMGLVGSLEDLCLLDILQIVNVSRRTGILRLDLEAGGSAYVYFLGGAVQEILGVFDEGEFLQYFLDQGLVDEAEAEEAIARAGGIRAKAVFKLLDSGALNLRLVEQARRQELARRLKMLVDLEGGDFAFFLSGTGEDGEAGGPALHMPLEEPVPPQQLLSEELTLTQPPPRRMKTVPPTPEDSFADLLPPMEPAREPQPIDEPSTDRGELRLDDSESELPEEMFEAEIAAKIPEPEPEVMKYRPKPSLHPTKNSAIIVLAADDSIFKNLLWQRLLTHFAQVERVSSLNEYQKICATLLEKRRPFLAVVDLLMPTQDGKGYLGGLEILESSQVKHPEVKVILLSDLNDPTLLDMAKTKGAYLVLKKPELGPLQIGQLEQAIGEFAQEICEEVDRIQPPIEEEVASFFRELGAEQVSEGYRVRDQLTLLKGLMGELVNPHESSEISLLVLRLASEYFERAILFLVKKEEITGLGGFGETGDGEMMMQKVRRMKIPFGSGSLLDQAVKERLTILRKSEQQSEVDCDFIEALGTHKPFEMVAIPMISRGRVIAILYADNAISKDPVTELSGIEIFMAQAGLAMEKTLLERQLLTLKKGLSAKAQQD